MVWIVGYPLDSGLSQRVLNKKGFPYSIHHLQRSYTVSLIVRFFADVSWKCFCFLAYAFLMLSLFHAWLRFVFSVRMSSHWFVKQLFNCLVHCILEIFYDFHLVSPLVDLWWTFFVFQFLLITFVIWGWLLCHLSLPYFYSMVTRLSCHLTSLCWQASWDLLPCIWWNFFHHSLFCYNFCNVLDILSVWFFSSRFPYCFCLAFWCRSFVYLTVSRYICTAYISLFYIIYSSYIFILFY